MSVSFSPPPGEGSLTPTGSPPSVELQIEVTTGGVFNAYFSSGDTTIFLESGLLAAGSNTVRIGLPAKVPAGSTLIISASDLSGCDNSATYTF